MNKSYLGTTSTTFSPTHGKRKGLGKLRELKNWLLSTKKCIKKSREYKNNRDGLIDPIVDPYSEEIYKWIEEEIQKGFKIKGLKIPGKHPKKSKQLGSQIESDLYKGLEKVVTKYLDNLNPGMTQTQIIAGVEDLVRDWTKKQQEKLDGVFRQLHEQGFIAGTAASGVKTAMKVADKLALEWIARNPNRIGASITTFGSELVDQFRGIIAESFGPEGAYSVPELRNRMSELVETERYKLERIVRTEVAGVSGIGRLLGWSKDPDKYYYEYLWINPMDDRSKPISKWRVLNGPYTYDEAVFLWERQGQNIEGKIYLDFYNQRCSLARRPIDNEWKGNRFAGDNSFIHTTDLGFT